MFRLMQFRRELSVLWRAFFAAETPWWLKALMLVVPLYLVSPIDIIPDWIPIAGWLDDAIVIPFLVGWLVRMLPNPLTSSGSRPTGTTGKSGTVIDGTARRL